MELYNKKLERYLYHRIDDLRNTSNELQNFFVLKVARQYLTQLRKLEYTTHMGDLLENTITPDILDKNMKTLNFVYHLLFQKSNISDHLIASTFIDYYSYCSELYERNAFFYRVMNKNRTLDFNNIRVVSVIEHNKCVEYVYKHYREQLPTVITFDSHEDVNGIKDKHKLNNYFNECEHETIELNTSLYKTIPFIGSVLYPMIFPYKNNNGIITIIPEWSNLDFYDDKLYIDRNLDNKNCEFLNSFIYKETNTSYDAVQYKLCDLPFFNTMDKTNISNDFILNIDLDYFCANGNNSTDTQVQNYTDMASYARTIFDYNHIKSSKYRKTSISTLYEEIKEIRKRIDNFVVLCKELHKNGKTPSMIIIADSTECCFTDTTIQYDNETAIQCSNNFTPKYLILWIKTTVYNHLKTIFSI
tara:strand:- start:1984 stop:3231 length:1248 start_codon:yes stop_codon:yes gene_type:complete